MNSLIDLYDNFLIYYPNIFFPLFLLFIILGVILLIKASFLLIKESEKFAKKMRINLSKIKIKKKERIKIFKSGLIKNIFYMSRSLLNFISKVSNISKQFESQAKKIILKIKREIFID